MTLAGLDLNATCAQAVSGPEGAPPRPLTLDPSEDSLPMALSLRGRHPQVGRAGAALYREYPHLVCHDFLAHLGAGRTWSAHRHRLDAARAVSLVFDHLRQPLGSSKGLVLALPAYVNSGQATLLCPLARKAKLPLLGSVTAPLAAALTAHVEHPWSDAAILVDVDDHTLTWTMLQTTQGQVQALPGQTFPRLSLHAWKGCLVNAIADCCVRHSRRDPRDSGAAEQMLYDQLDKVLEATLQEEMVEVVIRATQWCQNLILQPWQVSAFCQALIQEVSEELAMSIGDMYPTLSPSLVLVTAAASRLPGLLQMLREYAADMDASIVILPPTAVAQGAHALAVLLQRGGQAQGHFDAVIPLPKRLPAGPVANPVKRVLPIKAVDR